MYSQYFQFGSAQQDTGVDTEGVCMILEPGCPRIEHTPPEPESEPDQYITTLVGSWLFTKQF